MDISGTVALQDEEKTSESVKTAEKKSMDLAAFEPPIAKVLIEPECGTGLQKSMEGSDLGQEADVGREKGKERQVADGLDHGEAMQVDSVQMQGGSHSLVNESTDDTR